MQKSKPDALERLLQTCAMSQIYSAPSSKRLFEEPLEHTRKKAAVLKELWQEGTSYLHRTSIHLIDDQLQHNKEHITALEKAKHRQRVTEQNDAASSSLGLCYVIFPKLEHGNLLDDADSDAVLCECVTSHDIMLDTHPGRVCSSVSKSGFCVYIFPHPACLPEIVVNGHQCASW